MIVLSSIYGLERRPAAPAPWRAVPGLVLEVSASSVVVDDLGNVSQANDVASDTYHAIAPSDPRRPLYVADAVNGEPALRFTAAQFHMLTISGDTLNLVKPFTMISVVAPRAALVVGRSVSATGGNWTFGLLGGQYHTFFDGSQFVGQLDAVQVAGRPVIDVAISGATAGSSMYIRNGAEKLSGAFNSALVSIDPLGFNIGAQSLGNEHANCDLLMLLGWRRVISYTELQRVIRGLERKFGVPGVTDVQDRVLLTDAASVWDSATDVAIAGEHRLKSPLSRTKVWTTDTALTIQAASSNNTGVQPPVHPEGTYNEVGIYIDGVWRGAYEVGADNATRVATTLALDGARHEVEIVNGLQDLENKGTTGIAVRASVGKVGLLRPTAPAKRLVIYGDSIASGVYTDIPARDAIVPRLRMLLGASWGVALEAYGGRTLNGDTDTAPHLATLVARLAALLGDVRNGGRQVAWLAAIVNDYGQGVISPATFKTRLTALVTALRAAVPNVEIVLQNSIDGTTTTANALGYVRADYDAIPAEVAAEQGCHFANAKPWVAIANEPDGLHPDTTGAGTYATGIYNKLAALGFAA